MPVSAYALSDKASGNVSRTSATERINAAKERARENVMDAKDKAERKLTLRVEKCEDRKDKLITVVPNLSKSIESLKSNLDKNYDRIKVVKESGKLSAVNYDDCLYNKILTSLEKDGNRGTGGGWAAFYNFKNSFAYFNYSYVTSIHKAQGNSISHVFIIEEDIYTNRATQLKEKTSCYM